MREEKHSTAADYGTAGVICALLRSGPNATQQPVNDSTDVAARRFLVLGLRDQHRSLVEGVQYDVCNGIHSLRRNEPRVDCDVERSFHASLPIPTPNRMR
jgi:hypothetical protein